MIKSESHSSWEWLFWFALQSRQTHLVDEIGYKKAFVFTKAILI
jgi:hypothetical protein